MSKNGKDRVDFRSGSESLFQAVRADHEASAADCARVEAELARRLAAGASTKLALDGDELPFSAKLPRAFMSGTSAKLWIGVSLLAAGSFAIVRSIDFSPARDSRSAHAFEPAPTPPAAPMQAREPATEARMMAPGGEPSDTPLQPRAPYEAAARGAQSRGALRNRAAPKRPVANSSVSANSASNPDNETISPTPASESVRANTDSSTAEPSVQPTHSRGTLKQSGPRTSVRPPTQPGAAATLETSPAAAEASARTNPPSPTAAVRVDGSADAREELSLIERMHAAMRAANPSAALALCAEHAKRWPRGIFTEEREAVSAIASCALRSDDAVVRARLFLSKHPRAPTAPRVAAACAPLSAAAQPAALE